MNNDDKELLYRTDERVQQLQTTVETRFDSLEQKIDNDLGEVGDQVDRNDQRIDKLSTNVQRNTTVIGLIAAGVGSAVTTLVSKLGNILQF